MSRDWREPFVAIFIILALLLGLLAWRNHESNAETSATFAGTRPTANDETVIQPLPTPSPTPLPERAPAVVDMAYASDAVTLTGTVQADAIADALVAAATSVVGVEAVQSELVVDPDSLAQGIVVVIVGEVLDDEERARVVGAFEPSGAQVRDNLIIAGSDLTILDVIGSTEGLGQMSDFLAASGVANELSVEGELFTVFVPTDAAIEALDVAALRELSDVEQLADVTRFHIIPGARMVRDLEVVDAVATVQGESLAVSTDGSGAVSIGDATVVTADIQAVNGVVHVIDAVLLPGTLATEIALNRIVELDPVQFGVGSADIADASLPILDQAAAILADNPVGRVEIEGHTDTDGEEQSNRELSQLRAEAVRDYLVSQGVATARLTAVGYGETRLKVTPEETDADKAANRRIEFRVS